MKKILVGAVLSVFLLSSYAPAYALGDEAADKIEAAGDKVKDLLEKYEKASTTKWNEVTVTAKDTDGNPRDCTVRVYYNDYKQEKFSTVGGSFTGQFDHGKTSPTKVLSVAVEDCPCRLIKMDQRGPVYPQIVEEIEKMKIVIEDEVGGAITDKLTEEGKELVEKGLTKFFEGLGYGGSAMAKRFMGAVGVGAELGAPVGEFITKKIDEIFDAVREEARVSHELTGDDTPVRNNVNIIKPRSKWRNGLGLTKPTSFSKYEFDLLLQCPQGARDPKRLRWMPAKWIKPITVIPETPKPPVHTGERQETDEEYRERIRKHNEEVERRNQELKEYFERRAAERAEEEAKRKAEAEAKAKAEAEAQAKAERIAKECKKCDKLKQALEDKRAEVDQAWDAVGDATDQVGARRDEAKKAARAQAQAEAKRDNFNEPGTDYVESDGRRIDATDIELRNAAAELGWERYQAGELTAQEVSDYWQSLDADAVDALRAKVKADLEAAAQKAKEAAAKAEQAIKDAEADKQAAQDDLNKKSDEADKLESAYKDCLKKCQDDKKINLLQDYGIKVETKKPAFSWLPWNWDEEGEISVDVDPTKIAVVPDYSEIDYSALFDADGDGPTDEDDDVTGTDPAPTGFHSVLDEISTGPIVVNQHRIGQTGRLINVAKPVEQTSLADGTKPLGTGGFGAALQIFLDDGTVDVDDQLGITFSGGGMEPYEGPDDDTRKEGDPDANKYDFAPGPNDLDLTEFAEKNPGLEHSAGVPAGGTFVLAFSEPMDTEAVEDSFVIRGFDADQVNYKDPAPDKDQNFEGKIWDKNAFDVSWNSDDTEAEFTFKDERPLPDDPAVAAEPQKRKIIIIIIIDRRAQQSGLVNNPADYFGLPDGALDPSFVNAPPVLDPSFVVDGFEPDSINWGPSNLPHGAGDGIQTSGGEIDDSEAEALLDDLDLTNSRNNPPPPQACAGEREYEFENCSGACGVGEECKPAGTGCFECFRVCPAGQSTTQNCSGNCSNTERCAPADTGNRCFECVSLPLDVTPDLDPFIELRTPGDEISACEPECHGRSCGDDGCGGSCGSCAGNETCTSSGVCEAPKQCPAGSFAKNQCVNCEAGCEAVPNEHNLDCHQCKEPEPLSCNANFYEINGECNTCPAGCTAPRGSVGADACSCPSEPICEPDCHGRTCGDDGCGGSCGSCASGETCDAFGQCEAPEATCPAGSIADESSCNSQCSNGACNDGGGGCYSCLQCDTGSFSTQSACEAGGSNCEVGGSQGNLSCWVPVASCTDLCSQNGMSAEAIDFTSQVEQQLNSQTCVSSYNMQITQGTVGDCSCYSTDPPSITFDTTPPVCTGTVCGDVTCGQSASCPVDGGTATVTCTWGGWQKESQYQYRPLVGGN